MAATFLIQSGRAMTVGVSNSVRIVAQAARSTGSRLGRRFGLPWAPRNQGDSYATSRHQRS